MENLYDLLTGQRLQKVETERGEMYAIEGKGGWKKLFHWTRLNDPRFTNKKPSEKEVREFQEKTMIFHISDGDEVLGVNGKTYAAKNVSLEFGELFISKDDGTIVALCDYDGFNDNVRIVLPQEVREEAEKLVQKIKSFVPSKKGDEFLFLTQIPKKSKEGMVYKVTKVGENKLEGENEFGDKIWIYKNGKASIRPGLDKQDDKNREELLLGSIAVKKEFVKALSDREWKLLFGKLVLF